MTLLNLRYILLLVFGTAICLLLLSSMPMKETDLYAQNFIMADNLMCTIEVSSDKTEDGKKIALIGLKSQTPKVIYESGMTSPMVKVFESEKTLTIQLVATGSGSVDAIVIDKATGRFSRATAGSLLGVYSTASLGSCK
jgi:hypothetical protein